MLKSGCDHDAEMQFEILGEKKIFITKHIYRNVLN